MAGKTYDVARAASPITDSGSWPGGSRFIGFELASPVRPLGFAADGRLVAGRNYTVSGDDASTLTEADMPGAGSAGLGWPGPRTPAMPPAR